MAIQDQSTKWSYVAVTYHSTVDVTQRGWKVDGKLDQSISLHVSDMLNHFGELGWELVSMSDGFYYFKKPKAQ